MFCSFGSGYRNLEYPNEKDFSFQVNLLRKAEVDVEKSMGKLFSLIYVFYVLLYYASFIHSLKYLYLFISIQYY